MGLRDPHDKREFTHYVKLNADGSVAAIVEVADGSPPPRDADSSAYVDVTEHRRTISTRKVDLYAVKVDPKTLEDDAKLPESERTTLAAQFQKALDLAADPIKSADVEVTLDGGK